MSNGKVKGGDDGASAEPLSSQTAGLPSGVTGRKLVVLRHDSQKSLIQALKNTAGLSVASTADFDNAVVADDQLGGSDSLLLANLDIAVIDGDDDQFQSLAAAVADESNPVLAIEPEMYVIPYGEEPGDFGGLSEEMLTPGGRAYLRGYAEAVQAIYAGLLGGAGDSGDPASGEMQAAAALADTDSFTWGLQATRAHSARATGRGIRVAILDTGMDLLHPDFAGRGIISASFVPGQTAQDKHSHGTHCVGTACGPRTPAGVRRYGVATEAAILAGKVLSDSGSGQGGWILAGINWAIENKAVVISMSLGSPVPVGGGHSAAYEQAALAALNANSLIVAAAGNEGSSPVGSPANCPSVMAVASLDPNLQRSSFSCIGVNPNGGEVNLAAPGRSVFSSVPMPNRHGFKSGTSMATPHVAGIAALIAQETGARGRALWERVVRSVSGLSQPSQSVGAGLSVVPGAPKPVWRPYPLFPVRGPFFGRPF